MTWGAGRWHDLRDYVHHDHYPSVDDDVAFKVTLTVRARVRSRRGQSPPDPLDLIVPAADKVIRPAARRIGGLRCGYLQHRVAGELAELTSKSTKDARISDVYCRVKLDEETAARAREVQRMRHELELDELARQQARARAQFIRDECLADPATARVYTLLERSPRLGELAGVLDGDDLVAQLAQWHEPAMPVLIAQAVIGLLGRLTPKQSYDIVDNFIGVVRGYGAPEVADQLQALNKHPDEGVHREAFPADVVNGAAKHSAAPNVS
ncbi:hypothetical protein [Amycolatopsis panacis]|uniref:Uncharacterized protein n=1 Tax=Amycolatopsis panacis TaxID=2340917 RepID=A0A419I3G7_9PSEU|nr:hypothetical protein [Amycolatopsis panacis]RJQ84680.1 hypothetical protein D5S19_16315 [Amycolatopsis panacis]